jgi:hypothetical protein
MPNKKYQGQDSSMVNMEMLTQNDNQRPMPNNKYQGQDSSMVNMQMITQNDTFFKPDLKRSGGVTVKVIKIHYIRKCY